MLPHTPVLCALGDWANVPAVHTALWAWDCGVTQHSTVRVEGWRVAHLRVAEVRVTGVRVKIVRVT